MKPETGPRPLCFSCFSPPSRPRADYPP